MVVYWDGIDNDVFTLPGNGTDTSKKFKGHGNDYKASRIMESV